MVNPVVAFDESGNTRGNLLDPNQPVAVVASVLLSEEEASACIARLRAVTRQSPTSEVHYKGLKSDRGRQGVEALLRSDVLSPATVRVVVAHKPYAAVCKLVDLTLEPMFFERGVNLYQDGAAPATALRLYTAAPRLTNAERWGDVIQAFNRACARPEPAEFQAFGQAVDAWSETAEGLGDLAATLRGSADFLPDSLLSHQGQPLQDPLDPALPLFVVLAQSWGRALQQDFAVLHDHSTVIQRWAEILYRLDELPDPTGAQENLEPLRIPRSQLIADGDSRKHHRLQVADIVVGAVRTWAVARATGRPAPQGTSEFEDLTYPWIADAIWPSMD